MRLCAFAGETSLLEDKPRLQLKHPRRVDIRKRRDRIRSCSYRPNKLTKRRHCDASVTINRHAASEKVSVVEKIKRFEA